MKPLAHHEECSKSDEVFLPNPVVDTATKTTMSCVLAARPPGPKCAPTLSDCNIGRRRRRRSLLFLGPVFLLAAAEVQAAFRGVEGRLAFARAAREARDRREKQQESTDLSSAKSQRLLCVSHLRIL